MTSHHVTLMVAEMTHERLTDGSIVWNVVFTTGDGVGTVITFACTDHRRALALETALNEAVTYTEVELLATPTEDRPCTSAFAELNRKRAERGGQS
jgi:hypothetical protein